MENKNLIFGEIGYYAKDNKRLYYPENSEITPEEYIERLSKAFPQFSVLVSNYPDGRKFVETVNQNGKPVIINKGYICIKEASSDEDGEVLYIHDFKTFLLKERYAG